MEGQSRDIQVIASVYVLRDTADRTVSSWLASNVIQELMDRFVGTEGFRLELMEIATVLAHMVIAELTAKKQQSARSDITTTPA